jgi:hypothetical protein
MRRRFGGTGFVSALPMDWLPPRNTSMPADVMMNAGTPTYATQKPCQAGADQRADR